MKIFSILRNRKLNRSFALVADNGAVQLVTKTGPKGDDMEDNIVWGNLGVYEVREEKTEE